jgi:hypothetical protein
MSYQQAQLRWIYDNPVPDGDKTLYLVNAVVMSMGVREASKKGKWSAKMTLSDTSGQYQVKIWDGSAGEMPASYLNQTVAFNIKAETYKGNKYMSGFWEEQKAAIPPAKAASPPPMNGGATPSPAMRQDLPVFDENGQPMSLAEAEKKNQPSPEQQDRRDRGAALLAIATYNAKLPDYPIASLLADAEVAFNWVKTGRQAREPGQDDTAY